MISFPPRPVLDWKTIAEKARVFAAEHRFAEKPFPLDVEEIAEFDLNMEIRLVPGLLEEIDSPAQIAPGDGHPIITVDADQYRQQTSFYRYSIAHEIGHYVLHREWLAQVWHIVDSTQSWKMAVLNRSEDDYKWIEGQAEEFASYLLAPETVFEPFISEQIASLAQIAISLQSEDVLPYLAIPVAEYFGVSNAAAQARIRKSPQWKSLANRLNNAK